MRSATTGHRRPAQVVATLALAVAFMLVLVATTTAGADEATGPLDLERYAGADRFETAAAMSQVAFPDGAGTVVLARGDEYADALTAGPFARHHDAPVLLTRSDQLTDTTAQEIRRLDPHVVVVVGGEAAVTGNVVMELEALGIGVVRRVSGADRFETAARLAGELLGEVGIDHAYLVRGAHPDADAGWPDAVAIASLAAWEGRPVLLTNGDGLPVATSDALDDLGVTGVTLVGGTAAISKEVAAQLSEADLRVFRVHGADRYETSLAVAARALEAGMSLSATWVTTGRKYPDALAAGPVAAKAGHVNLLVDGVDLSESTRTWLETHGMPVSTLRIAGGASAVSDTVADELRQAIEVAKNGADDGSEEDGEARPEIPEDAVAIDVGVDAQSVVDGSPVGTHFVLASGVHRQQSITPRDGDRFSGLPGAVLSGARVVDRASFSAVGERWVLAGQEHDTRSHGKMLSGHEQESHGEELWADGERLRHVNSLDEVDRPGTWFFDYGAGEIWMFDEPGSFTTLELSETEYAFAGDAHGVVIEDVVVRHYANRAQRGAINARDGSGWTVRYVDASFNHGAGISIGPDSVVHNSRFTYNGQLGIHGSLDGNSAVVRDSEIAHNRQLGFRWTWEGGGTKFVRSQDMVFENNWVHHNRGPGAWWDIDNVGAEVRSNLVERNEERGIFYEISYEARIYWNIVRDHGEARGIYVANSADVEVFENALEGNHSPIYVRHADRSDGDFGARETVGLRVYRNDMDIPSGRVGLRVSSGEDEYFWDKDNRFFDNTYRTDRTTAFQWHTGLDADGWREIGNDTAGTFLPAGGTPSLPSQAVSFTSSHYGPRG